MCLTGKTRRSGKHDGDINTTGDENNGLGNVLVGKLEAEGGGADESDVY